MDLVTTQALFLDGLARAAGIDRDRLERPGVTVVGRDDRAGSNALACYRVGNHHMGNHHVADHHMGNHHVADHLVVWADPAVVDRATAAGLVDSPTARAAPSDDEVERLVGPAGFAKLATVVSNMLGREPTTPADLGQSGTSYRHRWLDGDEPGTVDLVRAFTERCDPDDVDAADLEDLDDFDEAALNVVVPAGDPDHLVAYASASAWDWDSTLADIGVLVHADHRRRGLANFVVANTVDRLLAEGRVPLYRHEATNFGSRAVAVATGFRPVARLDYYIFEEPVLEKLVLEDPEPGAR